MKEGAYKVFTGIVEETGVISKVYKDSEKFVIGINASKVIDETIKGDSIAVNGVCLTVVSISNNYFETDVMPETMNISSLKNVKVNDAVNLERALTLNTRFGGHIVTGHIDTVGKIIKIVKDRNAYRFYISVHNEYLKMIVKKGSVAIDGISLTVVDVNNDCFEISVIPHTIESTNLKYKKTGSIANIELDIIGKYVERLLNSGHYSNTSNSITLDFLVKNGF